jgi:GNAT superfamily N-acetyltransferase
MPKGSDDPVLKFRSVSMEREPARSLLAAMHTEMAALYADLDVDWSQMPKAGPAELGPPSGDFLVGFDREGNGWCGAGIKALPDGACEIKRLYVRPEVRRRGVAARLLAALEQRARELGYRVVRLDTGPRQPHSRRLFLAAGYRPIHNFNGNPAATFFGEKRL